MDFLVLNYLLIFVITVYLYFIRAAITIITLRVNTVK